MATVRLCSSIFKILLFSLSILADICVSSFLSEPHSLVGRNLLQAPKACPIDLEHANYTIITSQCKGPDYPAEPCCKSFKEFACPFAKELNDLSTICSTSMFDYIYARGNYPKGLFSGKCVEGKDGLDCSASSSPPQTADNTSGVRTRQNRNQLLMMFLTICLVSLLSML